MIDILAALISVTVELLKVELSFFGFTFTVWGLMIFSLVAGIIIDLIWRFLDGK